MPRSFEIDNLCSGDHIGAAFTLNLTVLNSDAGAATVAVTCPHMTPVASQSVPTGANPQPITFNVAHPAAHEDMTINVKMTVGVTTHDEEDVEEIDVIGGPRLITIGTGFSPFTGGAFQPQAEIAERLTADLTTGLYSGTYRRPGGVMPGIYILVVKKTRKRQYRIKAIKAATRYNLPIDVGGQDYRWEAMLPDVPAGNGRIFLRALWVNPANDKVRFMTSLKT